MPKPRVPKFRPDLSARLKDIAKKQVPARLKPIVDPPHAREPSLVRGPEAQAVVGNSPAHLVLGYFLRLQVRWRHTWVASSWRHLSRNLRQWSFLLIAFDACDAYFHVGW